VQGVGFRYTAQSIASRYDVRGYVKNLPDGRVELVMEGADEEMDAIVKEITERMDGFIDRRTDDVTEGVGEFESFEIRY
jgi:acylphosphatase